MICAFDPGFSGGISIINNQGEPTVFKMPVIKENVKKSNRKNMSIKQSYDLLMIRELLSINLDSNCLFVIEKVATMPGEGSVSSFNFGRGLGCLEGLIVGLFGKNPIFVAPQTWKKHFPELITPEILEIKNEIKKNKEIDKTIKDKEEKKQNKRDRDRLLRAVKAKGKDASRYLAIKYFPQVEDQLQKKNTDGVAESLLIALYAKNILINE